MKNEQFRNMKNIAATVRYKVAITINEQQFVRKVQIQFTITFYPEVERWELNILSIAVNINSLISVSVILYMQNCSQELKVIM